MSMKLLLGVAGAAACLSAAADANVIGFWDFKGGTAGTEIETVRDMSEQWTGTAFKANPAANKGVRPVYSTACPCARIFTDASRGEVLVENPQSLHFSLSNDDGLGGYVDIDGLSSELARLTAFTVEFFARIDDTSGNPWTEPLAFRTVERYASVTFGFGNNTATGAFNNYIRFSNLNVESPGTDALVTPGVTLPMANEWVHVAFVYAETDAASCSGKLRCYLNRELRGELAYTNALSDVVSLPLRLGTSLGNGRVANAAYNFRGEICALRVKSAALDDSGFMLDDPGDEPEENPYAVPAGAMLGFWDFKDGAAGAEAASVTNKGALAGLDPGTGRAASDSANDAGRVPVYSDDVPARYIYSSRHHGKRLADNPQSLLFTTQAGGGTASQLYNSVGGGVIEFPELGSAISGQKSFTIECFFKDEDWSEWKWESGLFGFCANREDGEKASVQLRVSSVDSTATYWKARIDAPIGAEYGTNVTWKGAWHHVAVVYDGAVSNISLYVDRQLGQTVAYTNYFRAGERFVLGSLADGGGKYAFRGKIAGLRIMPAALGPDDFLFASDRLPGLALLIR